MMRMIEAIAILASMMLRFAICLLSYVLLVVNKHLAFGQFVELILFAVEASELDPEYTSGNKSQDGH